MKRVLACLVLILSVWFYCFAEQKIVVMRKPSSEKKIPEGWHTVCITADGGDIIYVLEKDNKQNKEQKIVVIRKPSSEKKIPEGWHTVCITTDGGEIIYVLEKD